MSNDLNAVANFFIARARADGVFDLTPLKLNKLVYLANGWCLAIHGKPLFLESVEAFKYGPIVRSLLRSLEHYADRPVHSLLPVLQSHPISDAERDLLASVWRAYKDTSPLHLSVLARQGDSPWRQVWDDRALRGIYIPLTLMRDHFRCKLSQNRLAARTSALA